MSLTTEIFKSDGGHCKVELRGRLDTDTAKEFDEKIATLSFSDYQVVIADISQLEYVSSAGVRSLFKARKLAKDNGSQFLLINPQPQVQKVFDIIKALPSQSIFRNEEELDNYLDNMQRSVQ